MPKPIRYNVDEDHPEAVYVHETGYLVKHSDYAALAAENERLHKAGDAMAELMQAEENEAWKYCGTGGKPPLRLCVKKWLAAKEGKDAK